jgi:uncharacterized protein YecE (DUF72 family)
MKFGKVDNPEEVDFTLPQDHPDTKRALAKGKGKGLDVYVGCAKWSSAELKGFYPKGTKDELAYYASQFNSIELNATFRKRYFAPQYEKWAAATPEGFKFCPKMGGYISHTRRLQDVEESVDLFVENASALGDRMGVPYVQMHDNFDPKDFDRVVNFCENWKYDLDVAFELRKSVWYEDESIADQVQAQFEKCGIIKILVDTAGRRDMMHMRLTSPIAFIRWVGVNDETIDLPRLDEWVDRIASWKKQGMSTLYFFVHQNVERSSPLLSAYFIEKLNKKIGTDLKIPTTLDSKS